MKIFVQIVCGGVLVGFFCVAPTLALEPYEQQAKETFIHLIKTRQLPVEKQKYQVQEIYREYFPRIVNVYQSASYFEPLQPEKNTFYS